jgi:hypothetical protein
MIKENLTLVEEYKKGVPFDTLVLLKYYFLSFHGPTLESSDHKSVRTAFETHPKITRVNSRLDHFSQRVVSA